VGDVLSPLLFTVRNDVAVSTYDPPCEQWLTVVGTDAVMLFVLRRDWSVVVVASL
jgi:hypothetical protein